jgi:hypothetical protein
MRNSGKPEPPEFLTPGSRGSEAVISDTGVLQRWSVGVLQRCHLAIFREFFSAGAWEFFSVNCGYAGISCFWRDRHKHTSTSLKRAPAPP